MNGIAKITELVERAYGLLWSDAGGTARTNEARKLLREAIGADGQRRGIEAARTAEFKGHNSPIGVTGIWLKRIGDQVIVEAEIGGSWVSVIEEFVDCPFSHIVEPGGMERRYMDMLRAKIGAE
jgi:hypothetical protein